MNRLLSPLLIVVFSLLASSCSNRLGPHRDLLVGGAATEAPRPRADQVSVTYLGVNGYLIRSGETAILVDPFFSRVPMRDVVFKVPIQSSDASIAHALQAGSIPEQIDAFLITHSHFDHAFDVPALQKQLSGTVITSETGAFLCEAMGTHRSDLRPSQPGDVRHAGAATIRVLAAQHDLVLGNLPYPGLICEPLEAPPATAADWRLGTPLAYLIELGGKRIYLESGGVVGHPPTVSGVDLAIVGTAVGDGKGRYAEAVRALQPRFVLPSHQDNFFNPLDSGFHFSVLSDFPKIKAIHTVEELPGRLLLMDYFQTWMVP
jgi:L-ascorbate metabolism protein UlaG (beta-lactamase superfamily)